MQFLIGGKIMRTLYIRKKDYDNTILSKCPSAGPHPNITGMKEKYWGKDALCIKCGSYVYLVTEEIYNKYINIGY